MTAHVAVPRHVTIGDAAAFAGTTPRAVRHYHAIGLLPEPERGADDRRRYGYEDVVRLLWVRRMADAGVALADIRDAFADTDAPGDSGVAGVLERLERSLVAQEEALQRQRRAVQLMRSRGPRTGLLADLVVERLDGLPEGSLRPADLDDLLVTERILGPLGAAVRATRFIALARHPELRERSDRVCAAEEALDSGVAVDDPRVAQVAAERHAVEVELHAVIERSGLAQSDEELFDAWEALHPDTAEAGGGGRGSRSAVEVSRTVPHDVSPARRRCAELAEELAARSVEGGRRLPDDGVRV